MANVKKSIALDETLQAVKTQLETLNNNAIVMQGPKGDRGYSPYELAAADGYDGTEAEWLASLKGDTGNGIVSISKTTTAGLVDTYTITYSDDSTATFTVTNGQDGNVSFDTLTEDQVASLKGDKGDPGMTQAEIETYIGQYITANYENANEGSY